ncbi:hypothetical protein [Myroides sp. WP-1]|uniref:hypothetical protein n=1 Tax=Myroides sp. WP-1 TaxID=2759944 RepID=UPI0015FA8AE0|nr:hypothetical protein [Myroides sp. WP-1]MBB1139150.1 hypothetical protein [Myroides sp. WP-1]
MRKALTTGFDFYLKASVHVSFAVFALVQMTFYFCRLPFDWTVSFLAFSGTLFSYNFIKYADFVAIHRRNLSPKMKTITYMSFLALLVGVGCFFFLNTQAQLVTVSLLVLAVLYAVPISKRIPNLRNWSGLKVYIVCLCWATVTLIIPILNANVELSLDIWIKFLQRFILVLILIGIFEIVDLQYDEKYLKTIPQLLGTRKTKILLALLLVPFFVIEFFKVGFQPIQAWNNLIIVSITLLFIQLASPKRSTYFSLFWVESVPIYWWILVLLEG